MCIFTNILRFYISEIKRHIYTLINIKPQNRWAVLCLTSIGVHFRVFFCIFMTSVVLRPGVDHCAFLNNTDTLMNCDQVCQSNIKLRGLTLLKQCSACMQCSVYMYALNLDYYTVDFNLIKIKTQDHCYFNHSGTRTWKQTTILNVQTNASTRRKYEISLIYNS